MEENFGRLGAASFNADPDATRISIEDALTTLRVVVDVVLFRQAARHARPADGSEEFFRTWDLVGSAML